MGKLLIVCIGGALGYAAAYLVPTVVGCFAAGAVGLVAARLIVRFGSGLAG